MHIYLVSRSLKQSLRALRRGGERRRRSMHHPTPRTALTPSLRALRRTTQDTSKALNTLGSPNIYRHQCRTQRKRKTGHKLCSAGTLAHSLQLAPRHKLQRPTIESAACRHAMHLVPSLTECCSYMIQLVLITTQFPTGQSEGARVVHRNPRSRKLLLAS